jgi:hypothetical protein
MDKTIRSVIRRRVWTAAAAAFGGWFILAISGVLKERPSANPLSILGFILFMGAILFLNFFVKCPKCVRRIGHTIAMPVAFGGKGAPNFCPFCGVNLDEKIPEPREPSEADGVTTPDKLIWK